jgi:hypothetical protein
MTGTRLSERRRAAAARLLRHERARRILERRHEVDEPRRGSGEGLPELFDADALAVDGHRSEARAEAREDVDRSQVRRVLEHDGVSAPDVGGSRDRDRLLRAVGDEHLLGRRRQAPAGEVRGDRAPQLGKSHRQVARRLNESLHRSAVESREIADEGFRRRQMRSQELDGAARSLDEPAVDGIRADGSAVLLRRLRRRRLGSLGADARPASLPALNPLLLAENLVCADDGRPREREHPGEDPFRGKAYAGSELAPPDRGAQRIGEQAVRRPIAGAPVPQRTGHVERAPGRNAP